MNEKTFLHSAKKMRLSPAEKAQMKDAIAAAMSQERAHAWWLSPFKNFTSIVASFVILSIVGASASYAAENAMPGDMLYSVKIGINEGIPLSLARNTERKAEVELWRIERRLHEIQKMAEATNVTSDQERIIDMQLKKRSARFSTHIATLLAEKKNMEAGHMSMELAATLEAHDAMLTRKAASKRFPRVTQSMHDARMEAEEATLTVAIADDADDISRELIDVATKTTRREIDAAQEKISMRPHVTEETKIQLLKANQALTRSMLTASGAHAEQLRRARSALRAAKEAVLITEKDAPLSPMKSAETQTTSSGTITTETSAGLEADQERAFITEVQLRMTEKRVEKIREVMKERRSGLKEGIVTPTEKDIEESEQMMMKTKKSMREGKMSDAVQSGEDALKRTEKILKDLTR